MDEMSEEGQGGSETSAWLRGILLWRSCDTRHALDKSLVSWQLSHYRHIIHSELGDSAVRCAVEASVC